MEGESLGKGAEPDVDHTHLTASSSPTQSSPLVNSLSPDPDRTTDGSTTTGQTDQQQDRLVLNGFEDRATGQPAELSSIHDSLIMAVEREMATELRESATFSPSEETVSAGCGQLESSSRQQDTSSDSITPTPPAQLEVKVRQKTPPPMLAISVNSLDTPRRCKC